METHEDEAGVVTSISISVWPCAGASSHSCPAHESSCSWHPHGDWTDKTLDLLPAGNAAEGDNHGSSSTPDQGSDLGQLSMAFLCAASQGSLQPTHSCSVRQASAVSGQKVPSSEIQVTQATPPKAPEEGFPVVQLYSLAGGHMAT